MKHVLIQPLGSLSDDRQVTGYELIGTGGMRVLISDFGGTIWKMMVPDRAGNLADVVCGYDDVRALEASTGYLGALIGRWANRIGDSRFTLDGVEYPLFANNGKNHLHGGRVGFDRRFWQVSATDGEEPSLILTLLSPDGEEGYPGNLTVTVTYTLRADNALAIHYRATTDKKTIINLTNHAYFNLGGYHSGEIFGHVLQLDATHYLNTTPDLIPTGEICPVDGTPFDFRTPKTIGRDFHPDDSCPAMKLAGGYDHCFVFAPGTGIVRRGTLNDPVSGRVMEMYTDQPCVQLYTANYLRDDGNLLKGGVRKRPNTALCLETQIMPDSMHHPGFTSPYLDVGEVYDTTTIYRFLVD